MISVVILTLNEEVNLPGALASLKGLCDDVVVFDSLSSDATLAIAGQFGARVHQRRFDHYAAQRMAALSEVAYTHPWLLMLDADERVTPELWAEMVASTQNADSSVTLFRMRRKDYFMRRWLRRSSGYPTWFGRLMRIGYVRVEREINEEYITEGRVGYIAHHLVHFPFNRGIDHWIDRHNRYSTAEARKLVNENTTAWHVRDLWSADPTARRRALKRLAYRLPFRPAIAFLYLYVIRLGLLDGIAGYRFCRMRAMYEYMIDLKVAELRTTPVPGSRE